MLRPIGRRSRTGLRVGAAVAALAVSTGVQAAPAPFLQAVPNFGSSGAYREDPASALARYLRMVTASPQNLEALTGAGRAALEVGDPQAAIGFYARAEAISPRNGRIKAGLGSALVLLNQEQAALRYFEEAVNLGVPEAEIASDRGLAHDLRGSAKRAQRDYAVALKRGADAETTRRMALSLGISGERDAALAMLDPLLRRQDAAAWRARAFVQAMTGDAAGASRTAESLMSPTLAAGFAPFFRKLPTLRPGEKAAAVHFGNFPGEGRPMRIDDLFNQAEVAARVALENTPRSALDAGSVDGTQVALGGAPNRAADAEGQVRAIPAPRPAPPRAAPVSTPRPNDVLAPAPRPSAGVSARPPADPVRTAANVAAQAIVTPSVVTPAPSPTPPASAVTTPTPSATPVDLLPAPASTAPTPGFNTSAGATSTPAAASTRLADVSATLREVARPPVVSTTELPPSSVASADVVPSSGAPSILPPSLTPTAVPAGSAATMPTSSSEPSSTPVPSDQLASLRSIFSAAPTPAAGPRIETAAAVPPPAPRPKIETPATPASTPPADASAAAGEDSRVWVQIAGGADETLFPGEWRRLRGKAPELLTSQTPWTTPLKATNRLLVGPFESQRAAQDFVNKLAPKGITAFAWTSAQGQAITKLATRR